MALDRHGEVYQRVVRQWATTAGWASGCRRSTAVRAREIEQTIFANEAQYADVHLPRSRSRRSADADQVRQPEQKDLFLKRILAGDVHFAIGYSEPDAGTDLASLRTSARKDGDHYVVNGQKLWNHRRPPGRLRLAGGRTDPDAPSTRASRS